MFPLYSSRQITTILRTNGLVFVLKGCVEGDEGSEFVNTVYMHIRFHAVKWFCTNRHYSEPTSPVLIVTTEIMTSIKRLKQLTSRCRWPCGLRRIDCLDRVFESRWVYGFSSHVHVVCCVESGICNGIITGSEDSDGASACLIVCDLQTSTRHLGPIWAVPSQKNTPSSLLNKTKITILSQINYTRALKYCRIQGQIFPRKKNDTIVV